MILWDGSRVPKQGIISAILSRKIASRNLFNIKRKIGNSHFSFKSILKDFFFFFNVATFFTGRSLIYLLFKFHTDLCYRND